MCSAPNVYMFVYILIGTHMVPLTFYILRTEVTFSRYAGQKALLDFYGTIWSISAPCMQPPYQLPPASPDASRKPKQWVVAPCLLTKQGRCPQQNLPLAEGKDFEHFCFQCKRVRPLKKATRQVINDKCNKDKNMKNVQNTDQSGQ